MDALNAVVSAINNVLWSYVLIVVLVGCGICIEKAFQPGGDMLRSKGVRVESLARVKSMSEENGIEFC